jgi:glycosyltransferase involved in cell wall biosynthesis
VIASNLPGVRQPVSITGMGRIFNTGDTEDLAASLLSVFNDPDKYSGDPEAVASQFSPDNNAREYERLYQRIMEEIH